MKDIKLVELVFENCEVLNVPIEFIGLLEINGIRTKRSMLKNRSEGKFTETTFIDNFAMAINRKLNDSKEHFETTWSTEYPLTRIDAFNDITGINIFFTDETSEEYYPTWVDDGKDEYSNTLQKSKINSHGDLFLGIDKNTQEQPYFTDDVIEYDRFLSDVLMFGDK